MLEINKINVRIWSMLGMRRIIGVIMNDFAMNDSSFLFLTADLGRYFGYEELVKNNPEQVIELGISEQNMIGVAAGLANEEFNIFAATYASFIVSRALDQVRVNCGIMNLPIKLIGAAGGLSDGNFSATHMALEDVENIRAIPGITILEPADGVELVKALYAIKDYKKPVYVRLTGRAELPIIYKTDYFFEIGKAIILKEGKDVAIIGAGTILNNAIECAKILEERGIYAKIIDMHTIRPLDVDMLDSLRGYKLVVTVQEHMEVGGLYGTIAEYFAQKKERPVLYGFSVKNCYPDSREYNDLLEVCGMTPEKMCENIEKKLEELNYD